MRGGLAHQGVACEQGGLYGYRVANPPRIAVPARAEARQGIPLDYETGPADGGQALRDWQPVPGNQVRSALSRSGTWGGTASVGVSCSQASNSV